tara:strand:+ start:473 stop:811 length:339 start_codon:yes stop_codon:yes gene_type:complete
MPVSNESNPRQTASNPESPDVAPPQFPMPENPFLAVIWGLAFLLVICMGVALDVPNPLEWLVFLVVCTPLAFVLVLIVSIPCMYLYYAAKDACRWLFRFVHWLFRFVHWLSH